MTDEAPEETAPPQGSSPRQVVAILLAFAAVVGAVFIVADSGDAKTGDVMWGLLSGPGTVFGLALIAWQMEA